ncbi:MAG: acyl-CoA thioesterase [Allomuricauda sp.]
MFFKEFEIRWSDLDANRHLGNSAYINLMTHTRMSYMGEVGLDSQMMAQYNIGPVVFYEHMYYFKEVFPGKPVKISLDLKGLSKDGMFFEFKHDFYDSNGKNFARCEMMGAWMNLQERKLTSLPQVFLDAFDKMERAENFKILTKADTRKHVQIPKDL